MASEQTSNVQTGSKKILRQRWLKVASIIFISLGIIFLFYWIFFGRFNETTDDAYVTGNLVQVMPQISGHVTEILADETDFVKKGEPLVMLDKADAYITLQNAESQLALVVRQVSQIYSDVDELKDDVHEAQDNVLRAKEDYDRRQKLQVNKTISIEDLRHAQLAFIAAKDALASAQKKLSAEIAIIGKTDLYHHPQIQSAIIKLREAYLMWVRTTITAPATGYVAKRQVEIGQEVTPDTVMMIVVPLNQIWIDAFFKETQLSHMRIGQPVTIISDIYGSAVKFKGKVMGIGAGAGDVFDLLPPQNATGNWIKIVQRLPVRVSLDTEELLKSPLRLGLSVTVTVNTHDRNGLMLAKMPGHQIIYQTHDDIDDLKNADQLIKKILLDNAKNTTYQPSE